MAAFVLKCSPHDFLGASGTEPSDCHSAEATVSRGLCHHWHCQGAVLSPGSGARVGRSSGGETEPWMWVAAGCWVGKAPRLPLRLAGLRFVASDCPRFLGRIWRPRQAALKQGAPLPFDKSGPSSPRRGQCSNFVGLSRSGQDSVIVAASSMIFGDHIPGQQQIGFVIIMNLGHTDSSCWAWPQMNARRGVGQARTSLDMTCHQVATSDFRKRSSCIDGPANGNSRSGLRELGKHGRALRRVMSPSYPLHFPFISHSLTPRNSSGAL